MNPLVRCGGCGAPPPSGGSLRRGRCPRCYEDWVKARPVGVNGVCAACDDRRLGHLRYWELISVGNARGGRWLILCHNCAAAADRLHPVPRSLDAVKLLLARDRRWGDRRAAPTGMARPAEVERRAIERRLPQEVPYVDELVIELEAEFATGEDEPLYGTEEITDIHLKVALPE